MKKFKFTVPWDESMYGVFPYDIFRSSIENLTVSVKPNEVSFEGLIEEHENEDRAKFLIGLATGLALVIKSES